MPVAFTSPALCAWVACALASMPTHAADVASGGDASLADSQKGAKPARAAAGTYATAGVAGRQDLITAGALVHRAAIGQHFPTRNAQRTASQVGSRALAARSGGIRARGAQNLSVAPNRPTFAGANPICASGANHALNSAAYTTATTHGLNTLTASPAAGRPSAKFAAPLNRPATYLKSLAGNSTIGGPRSAQSGILGGTPNPRLITRSGIDGSLVRRRF
jgi:hypothetical protein